MATVTEHTTKKLVAQPVALRTTDYQTDDLKAYKNWFMKQDSDHLEIIEAVLCRLKTAACSRYYIYIYGFIII